MLPVLNRLRLGHSFTWATRVHLRGASGGYARRIARAADSQ
jgi:hypothetical protein